MLKHPALATVLEAMDEGMIVWDAGGAVVQANARAADIFGLSREALLALNEADDAIATFSADGVALAPADRPVAEALRTGRPSRAKVLGIQHPGGRLRWLTVNSVPLGVEADGSASGVLCTFTDVTGERRRREHYRTIIDRSLNVIALIDAAGRVRFVSAAIERRLGWHAADIVGRPALELVHPGDREALQDVFERAIADGAPQQHVEFRARAVDGALRVFEAQATPIQYEDETRGLQVSSRDITDHRRAEREIRELSARLTAVVEGLPIGIAFEDEHRLTCTINPALTYLFGVPDDPGALLGATAVEGQRKASAYLADPEAFLARIDELVAGGEPAWNDELRFADGRIALRHYAPVKDAEGQLGHVWLYRDVTADRHAEAELRAARDEALAATRAKSAFLATMSHEIRTPLNGILSAAELLAGTQPSAEQGELVAVLAEAGSGLRAVIDDVLDFSRIEAGKLPVRERTFAVREVLDGVRDVLAPAIVGRDLTLAAAVDDAVPVTLAGDADRLRQILLNLAGNAVKFTCRGSVTIQAHLGSERPDGVELVLVVTDTGPGIAAAERERLFQPFTQLDGSATRSHGGTGLGLAITRGLVDLLGGSIALDSTPGQGATFRVTLPLRRADAAAPALAPADGDAPLHGHVLLADDNELNRRVIGRQLERLGLKVTAVAGGREAIAAAAATPFDAILMDCRMPQVDGYAAARTIRAAERVGGRPTPIVAITANALAEDRQRCRDAGMDMVVTKPVGLDALRATLAVALPAPALDRAVLERLRADVDDDALLASVMARYAEELGHRAGAIVRAHEDGDAERLAAAAHALAAPSATIGLVQLGAACRELERRAATPDAGTLVARVTDEIALARRALSL